MRVSCQINAKYPQIAQLVPQSLKGRIFIYLCPSEPLKWKLALLLPRNVTKLINLSLNNHLHVSDEFQGCLDQSSQLELRPHLAGSEHNVFL